MNAPSTAGVDDRAAVLEWGAAHRRDLPWRHTRDPWEVLVSEVMLQQTQVDRVVPRWHRFLGRWPDPSACASAAVGAVIAEWQGLGYPRRARNLWLTARACVEHHDGTVPDHLDALLALPGVGPYTARAVLAFAFEQDTGVLDTNVARILARRAGRRLRPREAQELADAWVPPGRSWEWNQSLMDLGSTACRPVPECDGCPVACSWRALAHAEPDPAVRSAGVSRPQARYAGSDRQLRGRVLAAVGSGPQGAHDGPSSVEADLRSAGIAAERVDAVVSSLIRDGLLVRDPDGGLDLP